MKVKPLAFDSFGVRSMATYVKTDDVRILIDPGVSLAPLRFGLPPHPLEIKRLRECTQIVEKYAAVSDVLIVTHYHYDHHDLGDLISTDTYSNKILYIKHPTENINRSQKIERAPLFLDAIKGLPKEIKYADENYSGYGRTKIKFSPAVCHGTNPRLGYVVEVSIKRGNESFLHTSDVEGPSLPEQCEFILKEKPKILIVDGPMGYMLGYRYSYASLEASMKNLVEIVQKTPVESMLIDHHFMRDLNYRKLANSLYQIAEARKVRVITAAEFSGKKVELLEARRRELYKG